MDNKAQFENLMAGFGRTIGIDPLALDEDSGCTLSFDDQVVTVTYSEEEESLWLFSDLGMVPDEDRAAFYQHILAANFYRKQMGHAVLSYCEATDSIVLMLSKAVEGLEQAGLEEMVQDFVDLSETLGLGMDDFQQQTPVRQDSDSQASQAGLKSNQQKETFKWIV